MKKQFFLFLAAVLLPVISFADVVEIDGLYYELSAEDLSARVTSHPNQYSGSVVIPEKVTYESSDYNVVRIKDYAFQGCSELTSITIPNSVTRIGNYTFYGCTSLTSVTIPNSVTSIENEVFNGCSGLTSVTIPNSVKSIGDEAFYCCTSLTSITIPNSVTSIGRYAFSCCDFTSVSIPNSVTSIGGSAFAYCHSLISVNIPSSVTSLGGSAFEGCTSLTSVNIPSSVTSIKNSTFYGCSSLTSVTIPNTVTSIGDYAFSKCASLIDFYCFAEEVPTTSSTTFYATSIDDVTLHVPEMSVNAYNAAEPWGGFKKIVALTDDDDPNQGLQPCDTPVIQYSEGKLSFSCGTEGAEFVSEISDTDIKKHYEAEIQLTATYSISVYATKSGYKNSATVTATLCWIDATPETEGIVSDITQVSARAVMIQNNGGILTIQGTEEGTPVNVYSMDGSLIGTGTSYNGQTIVNTSLQSGNIAIVQIGQKTVKVIMR